VQGTTLRVQWLSLLRKTAVLAPVKARLNAWAVQDLDLALFAQPAAITVTVLDSITSRLAVVLGLAWALVPSAHVLA